MAVAVRPTQGANVDTWGNDHDAWFDASFGRALSNYNAKGDGTSNDTAAAQAWLNDTAAGSAAVVPPGTYMVDNLVVPAGVTAIRAHPNAIFKRRASGPLLTVNSPSLMIDGLRFDGQGAAGGSGDVIVIGGGITDVSLARCRIDGAFAGTHCLSTGDLAHRVTVRNSQIYGNVYIINSDDGLVDGNSFFAPAVTTANFGASPGAVTTPGNHADGCRIVNNYFEIPTNAFAIGPGSRNGAIPPRGTVISNNVMVAKGTSPYGGMTIDTCGSAAITGNSFIVAAGSTPQTAAVEIVKSTHVTLTGNDLDVGGVCNQGVSVNNSSDCVISSNTVRNPNSPNTAALISVSAPNAGNHCYRNSITNNELVNPSGAAKMISVASNNATATVEKTFINGNTFYGNASARGIWVDAGAVSLGQVTETTIANNQFSALSVGVAMFNDTGTILTDNRFASDVTTRLQIGTGGGTGIRVEGNDWQMATVVPASQLHFRGERVTNLTPTVGQPYEWVCTVTGTPGTWVALPNL